MSTYIIRNEGELIYGILQTGV